MLTILASQASDAARGDYLAGLITLGVLGFILLIAMIGIAVASSNLKKVGR